MPHMHILRYMNILFKRKEVRGMAQTRPQLVKGSAEAKAYMDKLREKAKAAAPRTTPASKTTVSFTASELEHLAKLIKVGYALTGDNRPLSQNLKKALRRMGISTMGL